ncbi:MAG TPA: hypothetical protein DHV74_02385, partial [Sulfitobacter sp.]|nr:hypothetical protein [Sulfitobacter sp.]
WSQNRGAGLEVSRTLAVNTLVMFELFYLFNTRFLTASALTKQGLTGSRAVLIAVALVISGAVLWWVHNEPLERWHRFAAGLLVGGALGNVIDRLIYGAVADFLNMSCCGISNPYAFNVADIAVFAGAFGMVLLPSGKKPS